MNKADYFLGIDLGSSSVKMSVFDGGKGKTIISCSYPDNEMNIFSPKSGWAEQEPDYWLECIITCFKILNKKIDFSLIASIGISYQMHGLVLLDKNGKILRPSIIWCDSRAVDIGKKASEKLDSKIISSHLLNSPGNFTASKLKWIMNNQPKIYNSIYKVMLPGDYIAYRLTGNMSTTESGLSEGILWDFKNKNISNDVISYFGFKRDLFPPILSSFGDHGYISKKISKTFGFNENTKLTYRAGDQPNNAFSLNVLYPGEIAATAGTSAVIYAVTDKNIYDKNERINTFLHCNNSTHKNRNGLLLCINGSGIAYSWFKKNLNSGDYNDLNLSAINSPIGSKNLKFYPFGNGSERILKNKEIGANLINLNFNVHDRMDLIRSVQEGVAFSMNYGIESLKNLGVEFKKIKVGNSNLFLSMLFREAFVNTSGIELEIYDTNGAEGAARAAALGIGYYANEKDAFKNLKLISKLKPQNSLREKYLNYYSDWKKHLSNFL